MEEYFAIVSSARAHLKSTIFGRVSEKTIRDYRAKFKRLVLNSGGKTDVHTLLEAAKQTKKVSTWFARRAAILYAAKAQLANFLSEQDNIQRKLKASNFPFTAPEWQTWYQAVRKIKAAHEALIAVQNSQGPAIEDRERRHSKKSDLKRLPLDWRERIIRRMPVYFPSTLAAAITGCRAAELVEGIEFSIIGDEMCAFIIGAKQTESAGQEWRRLFWNLDHKSSLVQSMIDQVVSHGGKLFVQIPNAKNLNSSVRSAGHREWPRRKSDITPHCFRHFAAADMKASSLTDTEISMALGHTSNVTKDLYGHLNMGSTEGVAPDRVQAAQPVREKIPSVAAQIKSAEIRQKKKIRTASQENNGYGSS